MSKFISKSFITPELPALAESACIIAGTSVTAAAVTLDSSTLTAQQLPWGPGQMEFWFDSTYTGTIKVKYYTPEQRGVLYEENIAIGAGVVGRTTRAVLQLYEVYCPIVTSATLYGGWKTRMSVYAPLPISESAIYDKAYATKVGKTSYGSLSAASSQWGWDAKASCFWFLTSAVVVSQSGTSGTAGSNKLTWAYNKPGVLASFSMIDPGGTTVSLAAVAYGNHMHVTLDQDGSGAITSAPAAIKAAVEAADASWTLTADGTDPVAAVGQTYLTPSLMGGSFACPYKVTA